MERVSAPQLAEAAAGTCERWHVPGMAVGVLQNGEVLGAAAGVRELGSAGPVEPGTVFRIASITKPFTATLAMTLVQDGLLVLDEPPPGTRVEATTRQLLSHCGGLASEWPKPLDDSADLLQLVEGEPAPLPAGAGELFSYCNSGFWFVAGGIARSLGTSFEEAMRTRVLEPLALSSTGFEPAEAAAGHEQPEPGADEHRPASTSYPRGRRAGGGLWSSVPDLLQFAGHHLGGPGPLTPASVGEMQRAVSDGPGFSYGLGWFLKRRGGLDVAEHPGSVIGFQSLLLLVPAERFAFAALTNSSRGYAAIRDVLRGIGLGDEEPPAVELPDLGRFAGRYRGQSAIVELAAEDGALRVARTEVDPFSQETTVFPSVRARPIGEREFQILDGEWRGDRFDFPRPGLVRIDFQVFQAE